MKHVKLNLSMYYLLNYCFGQRHTQTRKLMPSRIMPLRVIAMRLQNELSVCNVFTSCAQLPQRGLLKTCFSHDIVFCLIPPDDSGAFSLFKKTRDDLAKQTVYCWIFYIDSVPGMTITNLRHEATRHCPASFGSPYYPLLPALPYALSAITSTN